MLTTGMPIRQMQEFARLFREQLEAISDRRKLLEAHEQQVQAHIQELRRNLEMIQWKICPWESDRTLASSPRITQRKNEHYSLFGDRMNLKQSN
jgi:DNA-binding transcriptional MerR regulator